MIVFKIIALFIEILVTLYVICDLILAVRNKKYQKLWRLRKSTLVRIDPAITRAELCEQYVMFCKRNNCNVEY